MVVDFSALSIGTSFPFTRALLVRLDRQAEANLHAMVTSSPVTDGSILATPSSFVGPVHGFQGRWELTKLHSLPSFGLPQLRLGQSRVLEDLYTMIRPDDVVPVLPFPSYDPRLADRLIEYHAQAVEDEWAVDPPQRRLRGRRKPLGLLSHGHAARRRAYDQCSKARSDRSSSSHLWEERHSRLGR